MRAISSFNLEAGISTFWCRALIALRIRVSISATGSVNLMRSFSSIARLLRPFLRCAEEPATTCNCTVHGRGESRTLLNYQDDFETPGISPRKARPRKHNRQRPNLRRNARGRPQIWQRLCLRVENFGLGALLSRALLNVSCIFLSFTRFAVVMTPF